MTQIHLLRSREVSFQIDNALAVCTYLIFTNRCDSFKTLNPIKIGEHSTHTQESLTIIGIAIQFADEGILPLCNDAETTFV